MTRNSQANREASQTNDSKDSANTGRDAVNGIRYQSPGKLAPFTICGSSSIPARAPGREIPLLLKRSQNRAERTTAFRSAIGVYPVRGSSPVRRKKTDRKEKNGAKILGKDSLEPSGLRGFTVGRA